MLSIPYTGEKFDEIKVEEDEYLQQIVKANSGAKIEYKHLTLLGKIISRILSYNILPKTGSYTHISNDLLKGTYTVVKSLKVNWASLVYSIMKTRPTTFLPYGKYVTMILTSFKVPFTASLKQVFVGTIDYTTVKRMKLVDRDDREDNQEDQTQSQDLPSSSTSRAKITLENVYDEQALLRGEQVIIRAEHVLIRTELKKMFEFVEKMSEKVDSKFEEIIAQINSLKSEKNSTQEDVQEKRNSTQEDVQEVIISKGKEIIINEGHTEPETEPVTNIEPS